VITAAATIMVFVFGGFVLNGDPTVKQFGVGLAVAVILDATVVRCLLAPALMIMMGQVTGTCPHGSIDSSLTSASRAWSSSRSVRHALRASSSRIFDLLCGCSGAAT
jgi:RND superfamily putative drug exporter